MMNKFSFRSITILLIALLLLKKCETLQFVKNSDQRRSSMTLAMRRSKFSKQSKPLTRDRNNNDNNDNNASAATQQLTNPQQSKKLPKPTRKEEKSMTNVDNKEVRISLAEQIDRQLQESNDSVKESNKLFSSPSSAALLSQDPFTFQNEPATFFPPSALSTSSTTSTSTSSKEVTMKERVFEVVSNLLVADFFVIVGFLLWFVVGISTQSTAPEILQTFRLIFQPVVVPALTVLMVGSLASGLFNKDDKEKVKDKAKRTR